MKRMNHWLQLLGAALLAGPLTGAAAGEAPDNRAAPTPELVSMPPEEQFYTRELRDAGEQGRMRVKACIDSTGAITEVEILDSSGFERLDQAAMQFVRGYRFKAGKIDGVAAGGCYGLPVVFMPPPGPDPTRPQIQSRPNFLDFYPASARARGEQGRVQVDACFDTKGKVIQTTLLESSGFPALDQAGLRLAKQYRFRPGVVDGAPQAGCVQLPVVFSMPRTP